MILTNSHSLYTDFMCWLKSKIWLDLKQYFVKDGKQKRHILAVATPEHLECICYTTQVQVPNDIWNIQTQNMTTPFMCLKLFVRKHYLQLHCTKFSWAYSASMHNYIVFVSKCCYSAVVEDALSNVVYGAGWLHNTVVFWKTGRCFTTLVELSKWVFLVSYFRGLN